MKNNTKKLIYSLILLILVGSAANAQQNNAVFLENGILTINYFTARSVRWTVGDYLYNIPVGSQHVAFPKIFCASPDACIRQVKVDLRTYCNGDSHFLSFRYDWDDPPFPNPYLDRTFSCIGGGGNDPDPPETPLIFIPGIGGSTLYDVDSNDNPNNNLWLNGIINSSRRKKLSLNPLDAPFPKVVASGITLDALNVAGYPVFQIYRPLIEYLTDEVGFIEYETGGDPKKRDVDCTGITPGPTPTLFVFPYDWRKSNAQSADELRNYVACVGRFHPGKKVNILAHSMGGLVAKRYILNNPDSHNVEKVISIATPWFGAPKAIDSLFTGRFIGTGNTYGGVYWGLEDVKNIVRFGKGPHELLPSKAFFDIGGKPFAYKGIITFEEFDFTKTFNFINSYFPSHPYANNYAFHNEDRVGQDDWSEDTSGITYYHIMGEQACENTIGQVIYEPYTNYPLDIAKFRFGTRNKYTKGDGTVPTRSLNRPSNMLAPTTGLNKILRSADSTDCSNDKNYDHNGILANNELYQELSILLSDLNFSDSSQSLKSESQVDSNQKTSLLTNEGKYYLKITGVDRLNIFDEEGNTNTTIGDETDIAVDGINYEYGSSASNSFVVPHEASFMQGKVVDIKFTVLNDPLNLEILGGISPENPSIAKRYLDLQLPLNVQARLSFTVTGVQNLRYDADGDGNFETEVQPNVDISGSAANDVTSPTINVSQTTNNNIATLIINASDSQSGIRQVRYIISGESSDHVYSTPFTVNLSHSQLVYISAEDNAGNRNLIAKWLDITPPVTTPIMSVSFTGSSQWWGDDVGILLSAFDGVGGSGIKSMTFSGSGAQNIPEETIFNNNPFNFPQPSKSGDVFEKLLLISNEGITNLSFFARDNADNIEVVKTFTVKIDKSLPVSQHTSSSKGTHTEFALSASDSISGIGSILYSIDGGEMQIYTQPFSVSNIGTHVIKYYAEDLAGNREDPHVIYINKSIPFDFDGDGKTDISIFRPNSQHWWYLRSSDGLSSVYQFGLQQDKLVPADYTGDGKTDIAIWRPSTSEWFILRSEDLSFYAVPFGSFGDVPIPNDFDGDGISDLAVYRPSNQYWYVSKSTGGYDIQQIGNFGDIPVTADFDGDGKGDKAVFTASNGNWKIYESLSGLTKNIQFGTNGDKLIPADYTGDGKADIAFFRSTTNAWHILRSEGLISSLSYVVQFGTNGDIPVAGDFDGDKKTDIVVFRPTTNAWHILQSTNGYSVITFGSSGDIPVPSVFIP